MKKVISLILAVLLSAALFAGCGTTKVDQTSSTTGTSAAEKKDVQKDVQKDEKTTIKFATFNVREKEDLDKFLAEFQKENPNITVDAQYIPNEQFDQMMKSKFAIDDAPDVLTVWGIADYVKANYLMDITGFEAMKKQDPSVTMYTFDGKRYGMALGQANKVLFSNNKVLKECGIAAPPKNFKQLLDDCEIIKAKGLIPIAFGDKEGVSSQIHGGWASFSTMPEEEGKGIPQGTIKISQSKGIRNAFEKTLILKNKGYLSKDFMGLPYDQAMAQFAQGKAAFHFSAEWIISSLKSVNKDLDFTLSPYPYNDDGDASGIMLNNYGVAVNANSKVKDAIAKLFDAFATQSYANNMGREYTVPFTGINQQIGKEVQNYTNTYSKNIVGEYEETYNWVGWKDLSAKSMQYILAGQPIDKVLADMDSQMEKTYKNMKK